MLVMTSGTTCATSVLSRSKPGVLAWVARRAGRQAGTVGRTQQRRSRLEHQRNRSMTDFAISEFIRIASITTLSLCLPSDAADTFGRSLVAASVSMLICT